MPETPLADDPRDEPGGQDEPAVVPSPAPSPFPLRTLPTVRVDSAAEAAALLAAWPAPSGPWRVAGEIPFNGPAGRENHLRLAAPGGEVGMLRLAVGAVGSDGAAAPAEPGAALDAVMKAALDWAKEHEPTHPGALPRFPVPADGYPGRVAVPLALVAVDDRRRAGLYGFTRAVILSFPGGEVTGATDAPGFDPDRWPPARLGPWPPPGLDGIGRERLSATIARFSALWTRLLATWLAGADYPHRPDEAVEALALLARLDPPGAIAAYRALNPRFWAWLEESNPASPAG